MAKAVLPGIYTRETHGYVQHPTVGGHKIDNLPTHLVVYLCGPTGFFPLGAFHHAGFALALQCLPVDAQPAIYATAAICDAVHHCLKSVVRKIRTLCSVGAGGGALPSATRWL